MRADPTVQAGSKLLGETTENSDLTLRTSIVGLELNNRASLIEWFLRQVGSVNGFTQAIYSGLTTLELARVLSAVMMENPSAAGLFHAAMIGSMIPHANSTSSLRANRLASPLSESSSNRWYASGNDSPPLER